MSAISNVTHNPFNIRYSKTNHWFGCSGNFKGFAVFTHEVYAVRALFKLLINYIRKGYNTPEKIISRFAPPSENHTETYIDFVCDTDCARDFVFNIDSIKDKSSLSHELFFHMVYRMALFESDVYLPLIYLEALFEIFYADFDLQ